MKRKRFSVEQIVAVLKQAELGLPVADLVHQTLGRIPQQRTIIADRRVERLSVA